MWLICAFVFGILRWIFVELLLASWCTEVIGLAFVFTLILCGIFVDIHLAYWINRHFLPPFISQGLIGIILHIES